MQLKNCATVLHTLWIRKAIKHRRIPGKHWDAREEVGNCSPGNRSKDRRCLAGNILRNAISQEMSSRVKSYTPSTATNWLRSRPIKAAPSLQHAVTAWGKPRCQDTLPSLSQEALPMATACIQTAAFRGLFGSTLHKCVHSEPAPPPVSPRAVKFTKKMSSLALWSASFQTIQPFHYIFLKTVSTGLCIISLLTK